MGWLETRWTNSIPLGLVLVTNWIQWCRLIASDVMCVDVLGSELWLLSKPNRPDQPVNLSPVLWNYGPTGGLISRWTLRTWEMTLEPASCANKIWESRLWVGVTCPLSLHGSQMPGLPACLLTSWKRHCGGSEVRRLSLQIHHPFPHRRSYLYIHTWL